MTLFQVQLVQKLSQGFSAFWAKYPIRKAKKDAEKAWGQVVTSASVEEQIHRALDWQIPEWAAMTWYTPPLPATYLRNERWTDEPTTMPSRPTVKPPTLVLKPQTTMAEQQLDAHARIVSLINTGMSPDEAKQTVYKELGWIR